MGPETDVEAAETGRASSSQPMLGFNPQDMVSMRVRPAQFARMCEVSKQSVSDWIKRGVITLGPDGLIDPVAASRQVFERTDPARLRARVFKGLARDVPELKEQVRELRAELKAARAEVARLAKALADALAHRRHHDEEQERLAELIVAIEADFSSLVAAHAAGTLSDALDRMVSANFYRLTAAELAETYGED